MTLAQNQNWAFLKVGMLALFLATPSWHSLLAQPFFSNDNGSISEVTSPQSPSEPTIEAAQEDAEVQLFMISGLTVTGSSIFEAADFEAIVDPLRNQSVPLSTLQSAVDQVTQLYINEGYLTTRAILNTESLQTETVLIQVLEGGIESIELEGADGLASYVRARLRLGAGTPLNVGKLEDQLRVLQGDPLIDAIEASLRAGSTVGQSILAVRVDPAKRLFGGMGADNYSPPSVGGERLRLSLGYRNLSNSLGDQIAVSYTPRFQEFNTYTLDFGYRVPVNAMDGTVGARFTLDRNEVIEGPFETLDIRGNSELYSLNFRQPLIKTPQEELAFSVGFAYRDGLTSTFAGPTPFGLGPDSDGTTRTSVLSLGQDYTVRDSSGAWAIRNLFRFGLDIFNATDNPGDIPDGQFFSWLTQFQRLQVINPDNFLIIQADLQLTGDGLLASDQFAIGGGQSVRGYRQNVRSGDNGFRFTIEDRLTVARKESGEPLFIVAPFFDAGKTWNVDSNPNVTFPDRFIAAIGLGLLLQPVERLNLRVDYAPPLIDLDDRGDNVQDYGFYFSADYQF
ncbi:MAG: ShlB/FhaC/HecB family hemolysin secretion/activation protein [Cyanobacteria bacterium P01_H01_bin.15]